LGKLGLRTLIKCKIGEQIIETTVGRILFNQFLPEEIGFVNEAISANIIRRIVMDAFKTLIKR
jgi:DNA-directed RNA polymerase subunit beta'